MSDKPRSVFSLAANPLFLHITLAGLIWVISAEAGGLKSLYAYRGFLWDGQWTCRLFIFQTIRDIFNILDCWIPPALDRIQTPGFADGLYFLGILFVTGSLFGLSFGIAGWITGLAASLLLKIIRRNWHGAAWCVGFQLSVLLFALLKRAGGFYFTKEMIFEHPPVFIAAFLAASGIMAYAVYIIQKVAFKNLGYKVYAGLIASIPFIAASAFGYHVMRTPRPSLVGIEFKAPEVERRQEIKSIMLISIDTLRYDHTSVGRYYRNTTPELARFAGEGIVFDNCYSAAPWTLPSMMSLITGLSPMAHGVEDKSPPLADGIPTLAQIIRNYGWHTSAFYTTINVSSVYGFDRGYEDYEEFDIMNRERHPNAQEVNEKALPWLEANYKRPFFLAIHYFDPHWPYSPQPPYDSLYFPDYNGSLSGVMQDFRPFLSGQKTLSPIDLKYFVALYDAEIKYTDDQIGKVLDKLKTLGIYDDMMIIVVADHGEEFMEHGGLSHGLTTYQELIHIPLIIKFPAKYRSPIPPSSRMRRPVTTIDVAPTILDALGIPPYEGFMGRSLIDTEMTEGEWEERILFSKTDRHYSHHIAVIKEGMKFIHGYFPGDPFFPDKRKQEIYMLGADPGEKNNLAEARPEILEEMRAILFENVKEERKLHRVYMSTEAPVTFDEATIKRLEALGYLR